MKMTEDEFNHSTHFAHSKDITTNQATNEILQNIVDEDVGKTILKEILHQTILLITFTKKDGTERIMRCTLMNEHLPTIEEGKMLGKTKSPFPVFDMDKNQWRSINYDTISFIKNDGPPYEVKLNINGYNITLSSVSLVIEKDGVKTVIDNGSILFNIKRIMEYTR